MSKEHAHKQNGEEKKHGDAMERALGDAERHNDAKGAEVDPVPPAENGGHAHSVAAHLHETSHLHDNRNAVQHHVPSNQLRQPPQEVSRAGKGHRGQ